MSGLFFVTDHFCGQDGAIGPLCLRLYVQTVTVELNDWR